MSVSCQHGDIPHADRLNKSRPWAALNSILSIGDQAVIKSARKIVVEVDRERIAIAETFLNDAGMPKPLAIAWAFIGYAFTVGSTVLDPELVGDKMESYRQLLIDAQFPQPNIQTEK